MKPLRGRLGLATARIPQSDRHGVMWLGRGNLVTEQGTLHFLTAGDGELERGDYAIPFQSLSCLVMQPGTTVSHDALRLLAAHGTGLVFVGEGGVRFYASMPFGPDASARARRQAIAWADESQRSLVARRMYAWRMGEVFPDADIAVLRGLEGARAKKSYKLLSQQHGVRWYGRRYDRNAPERSDPANQAINHASVAVVSAAQVAVAVTGAIPQLGFIHEESGIAFALDIADLFRDLITVPCAFAAVKKSHAERNVPLERIARKLVGKAIRRHGVVEKMIDRIRELFDVARVDPGVGESSE
ncbi:MAG: type I-E CRISPR-associated endonuclease Cas1e [Sandaracinaceae bacterium]